MFGYIFLFGWEKIKTIFGGSKFEELSRKSEETVSYPFENLPTELNEAIFNLIENPQALLKLRLVSNAFKVFINNKCAHLGVGIYPSAKFSYGEIVEIENEIRTKAVLNNKELADRKNLFFTIFQTKEKKLFNLFLEKEMINASEFISYEKNSAKHFYHPIYLAAFKNDHNSFKELIRKSKSQLNICFAIAIIPNAKDAQKIGYQPLIRLLAPTLFGHKNNDIFITHFDNKMRAWIYLALAEELFLFNEIFFENIKKIKKQFIEVLKMEEIFENYLGKLITFATSCHWRDLFKVACNIDFAAIEDYLAMVDKEGQGFKLIKTPEFYNALFNAKESAVNSLKL